MFDTIRSALCDLTVGKSDDDHMIDIMIAMMAMPMMIVMMIKFDDDIIIALMIRP